MEDLQRLAEGYLGTAISPSELGNAASEAAHKLKRIIAQYGDADGRRQEPWYLAQLVAEAVRASRLSAYLNQLEELREKGIKKDSPCPKTQGRPKSTPIVAHQL